MTKICSGCGHTIKFKKKIGKVAMTLACPECLGINVVFFDYKTTPKNTKV